MAVKEGKVWGTTELVESNSVLEFHRIEFKRDVCCSEHEHQTKYNGFFVESGRMMVKVWTDRDDLYRYDTTLLGPGDFMKVEPGVFHQFIGVDDGVAFELYWSELHADDIVRRTQGHKINEETMDATNQGMAGEEQRDDLFHYVRAKLPPTYE